MDHAKAMQLARELSGPEFAPGPGATELERDVYCRLVSRIAHTVLPVEWQDEFLGHFEFYAASADLCVDEGCPHYGTPHVCQDIKFEPVPDQSVYQDFERAMQHRTYGAMGVRPEQLPEDHTGHEL